MKKVTVTVDSADVYRRKSQLNTSWVVGVAKICWDDCQLPLFLRNAWEIDLTIPKATIAGLICDAVAIEIRTASRLEFAMNSVMLADKPSATLCGDIASTSARVTVKAFSRLTDQLAIDRKARAEFDVAVRRLYDRGRSLTNIGFAVYRTEIRNLIRAIDLAINTAHLGSQSGWYAEKFGRVKNAIEELSRRKDPNRPRYEFFRSEIDPLFNFSSRDLLAWTDKPPIMHVEEVMDDLGTFAYNEQ